jgi:hypothetical protein
MNRRKSNVRAALSAALLVALAACEAEKSSNPLSPSVAGPIPGVEITEPKLLEPAQGFKFKENQQPIKLLIENSSTTGVRPVSYIFEVATDSAFTSRVFARNGVPPGEGGRTSIQLDPLELGRAYFWRARAEDGANNSTYATAGFEVLPRAVLTTPGAVSPANNENVGTGRPTLRARNSEHNSAVGNVTYFFIVAMDQAFTQVIAYGEVGEAAETRWTVDRDLEPSTTHFWRVRSSDGETTSAWSDTEAFRTAAAPAPSPSPSPSPSPGPSPGGPCSSRNPEEIVSCERAKFGRMSRGQILQFERNVARSLNRNDVSGGPFGILVKESGNNCFGYSCDIICAGQGRSQRQYDVLGDADGEQRPTWQGPKRWPDIREDRCEIQ